MGYNRRNCIHTFWQLKGNLSHWRFHRLPNRGLGPYRFFLRIFRSWKTSPLTECFPAGRGTPSFQPLGQCTGSRTSPGSLVPHHPILLPGSPDPRIHSQWLVPGLQGAGHCPVEYRFPWAMEGREPSPFSSARRHKGPAASPVSAAEQIVFS